MSAIVCGKRSSSIFFEELPHHTPLPLSKKIRCSSLSPPSSSSSSSSPSFDHKNNKNNSSIYNDNAGSLAHLRSLFPQMDPQLLERVFEASGNDLDSAIKSLNDLHLESAEGNSGCSAIKSDTESGISIQLSGGVDAYGHTSTHITIPGNLTGAMDSNGGEEAPSENIAAVDNLPRDGSEWVEVLVREMMNASDVDDARARASRVLDVLEKSIVANASSTEAMQSLHKENMMLKEQVAVLLKENSLLKRAVAIQHDRQKEYDERSQELQHLKQLVSQYQEQLTKLEVNNYALAMHLRQAQQSSSIPGRFHPDVF